MFFACELFPITKVQILKAIHNFELTKFYYNKLFPITKVQILKAIHNITRYYFWLGKLFPITKVQILKAIHNKRTRHLRRKKTVSDHKSTNFGEY